MGNLIFTIVYGGSMILYGAIMKLFLRKLKKDSQQKQVGREIV